MPAKPYRRLPGRSLISNERKIVHQGRQEFYLGGDHLLVLDRQGGYTERYKRFHYSDIQALTLCPSPLWWRRSLLAALLAGLLMHPVLWMGPDWIELGYVLFACGLPLLLFSAANLLPGPGVVCKVHTQVQTETLRAIGRRRAATRALALLRERIEAAQGAWPSESLDSEERPGAG